MKTTKKAKKAAPKNPYLMLSKDGQKVNSSGTYNKIIEGSKTLKQAIEKVDALVIAGIELYKGHAYFPANYFIRRKWRELGRLVEKVASNWTFEEVKGDLYCIHTPSGYRSKIDVTMNFERNKLKALQNKKEAGSKKSTPKKAAPPKAAKKATEKASAKKTTKVEKKAKKNSNPEPKKATKKGKGQFNF